MLMSAQFTLPPAPELEALVVDALDAPAWPPVDEPALAVDVDAFEVLLLVEAMLLLVEVLLLVDPAPPVPELVFPLSRPRIC
jgi:hypothetical protein